MTKWSQKIATKLKERYAKQAIQDQKFVEQQRLKRANGDARWQEVVDALRLECNSLTVELGEKVLGIESRSNQLIISDLRSTRELRIEFNSEAHQLHFECGDRRGHWHLGTLGNGSVTFVRGQQEQPITPEEIAVKMLDILLDTEN